MANPELQALFESMRLPQTPAVPGLEAVSLPPPPPQFNWPTVQAPQMLSPVLEAQIRQQLATALTPGLPALDPQNRSNMLLKLGTALMQAPRAGQSTAGMMGEAVSGAVDYGQAQRQAQLQRAMQQAQMGMTAMNQQSQVTKEAAQTEQAKSATMHQQMLTPGELRKQNADLDRLAVEVANLRASGKAHEATTRLRDIQSDLTLRFGPQEAQAKIRLLNSQASNYESSKKWHDQQVQDLIDKAKKDNKKYKVEQGKTDTHQVTRFTDTETGKQTIVFTPNPKGPEEAMQEAQLMLADLKKIYGISSGMLGKSTSPEYEAALEQLTKERDETKALNVLAQKAAHGKPFVYKLDLQAGPEQFIKDMETQTGAEKTGEGDYKEPTVMPLPAYMKDKPDETSIPDNKGRWWVKRNGHLERVNKPPIAPEPQGTVSLNAANAEAVNELRDLGVMK